MSTQTFFFFFFNDTATTEIYTLSLHDALPISAGLVQRLHEETPCEAQPRDGVVRLLGEVPAVNGFRSEEHTSELQSQSNIVCRLLLEKKKKNRSSHVTVDLRD